MNKPTNSAIADFYYDSDDGMGSTVKDTAAHFGISESDVSRSLADSYQEQCQGETNQGTATGGEAADHQTAA